MMLQGHLIDTAATLQLNACMLRNKISITHSEPAKYFEQEKVFGKSFGKYLFVFYNIAQLYFCKNGYDLPLNLKVWY